MAEDLPEYWRPVRLRGKVAGWIHVVQVSSGTEMNSDRFRWEVWDAAKQHKIGQSLDDQYYTRMQTASRGAERFVRAMPTGE